MVKLLKTTASGIYCITNRKNGKIYIGSASNLRQRWNGHISDLRKEKHKNRHLQRAWLKSISSWRIRGRNTDASCKCLF